VPSRDHAYEVTFALGDVRGRSPLPSARMAKSLPPKGPGVRRMNAIVPARFSVPARLAPAATATLVRTAMTAADNSTAPLPGLGALPFRCAQPVAVNTP